MAAAHRLSSFYYDRKATRYATRTIEKALGEHDVLIRTTHSGVCYTDVHARLTGCGLGHEGVGIIKGVGSSVADLKEGDRVGWGWLHISCGSCPACNDGYRQYCSEARGFAFSDHDQGAFGDGRIINAEFAYKIPDSISSRHAGPLMCAGASVFEALDAAGTKNGNRVGIVGLGGLGHMAVLFATAMGCPVTVLSNGENKVDDAFQLGASEFRDTNKLDTSITRTQDDELQRIESATSSQIDVLLVTSNAVPELKTLLPLLARRATIVLMTIQRDSLSIPYMDFVLPGHKLIASTEASRDNHYKMLDFVAEHQIQPWVEQFAMSADGAKRAMERIESNQMRYRGVLVHENMDGL